MSEARITGDGMRISTKIGVSVSLICLFLIGAIAQYRFTLDKVQQNVERMLDIAEPVKSVSVDLERALLRANRHEEVFLRTGAMGRVQEALKEFEGVRKLLKELKRLEKLEAQYLTDGGAHGDELVRLLTGHLDRYLEAFNQVVALMTAQGLSADQGLKGQFRAAAHQIEQLLEGRGNDALRVAYLLMRRAEKDFLLRAEQRYVEQTLAAVEQVRRAVEGSGLEERDAAQVRQLLGNYLTAFTAAMEKDGEVNRQILVMNEAMGAIEKLVAENVAVAVSDMAETATTNQQELERDTQKGLFISLGAILVALLSAIYLVRDVRLSLTRVISAISTSTSEIAATVNQQERVASLQAASVNETNTTMEELGASARQSAEQASASAGSTEKAQELAEHGMNRVEDMMEGMKGTREKVEAIARQILSLSEQTGQIANITNTVTDFANETKMLAMNAAVEAVRAGEHGKGFSVLSVEIRKLADESKRSAERISALVEEIQRATNATVMVTEEGTKTVEKSMTIAQNTAETFAEVAESVGHASESSQQISLNVRQQSVAVKQVVEAMNALTTGAKETASGITQVKVGIQTLNETAQKLKEMI